MGKKVLIISASPRRNSNSGTLAKAFADGAREAGNEVKFLSLRGKKIEFCQGCLACQRLGQCIIADDAAAIAEEMETFDVVVYATPVYFYEMSGQMKTLLDRMNPLYFKDYAFRDIYFLSTAAENEENIPKRAENGLRGWIDCFDKARLAGTLFCGGVNEPGEIGGNPKLKEAYEMGRNV